MFDTQDTGRRGTVHPPTLVTLSDSLTLDVPPLVHRMVHPRGYQGCELGDCPTLQPKLCAGCGRFRVVCVDWAGHAGALRSEAQWWRATS